MQTLAIITLVAAGITCFWVFFKSIDFFEDI